MERAKVECCCQWANDPATDCYHKASAWTRADNEYIVHGYRKTDRPLLEVLGTAFVLHNETFNIWCEFEFIIVFRNLLGKGVGVARHL